MKGKLFIFSAPSGSGKTTIVKHLLSKEYNLAFSVSATSRPPRGNEKNGIDYYFLSTEEFRYRIENNEFLEWEEVYQGTYYGTLKSEVERLRNEGKHVIFDVDVVGGCNIKKHYGSDSLAVFVKPPSVEELRKRLEARSTDNRKVIETRIAKAEYELTFEPQFDVVLINENLEEAFRKAEKIVQQFLETGN
ncbi:MAG: guanylate kinase [Prolixibacteraceae bacterium]|nr:guanylate kinase [Prolixibacteraceae bacterium]